jgi:hypothetical protein
MRLWISGRGDKPRLQREGAIRYEKAMWPIIYVRGYAMTEGEIEATTADPFCGFNLGSTG